MVGNGGMIESFLVSGLTAVDTRTTTGATFAASAVFNSTGTMVYVQDTEGSVDAFTFNPVTGQLSASPVFTISHEPTIGYYDTDTLTLSADGSKLYVSNYNNGSVDVFNASTGASIGSVRDSGVIVNPTGVAIHAPTTTVTDTAKLYSPLGPITTDLPTFIWPAVTGATSYQVYVVDLTTKQNPVLFVPKLQGNSYQLQPGQNLTPGHSFTWYSAAVVNGSTIYSNPQNFSIAALTAPTPGAPNSAILVTNGYDTPTFSWAASPNLPAADHYYLYVLDNTTGQPALTNSTVMGTTFVASAGLTPGHSFTWYVASVSANNAGLAWSGPQHFSLAPLTTPPTQLSPINNITLLGSTGYDTPTFTWSSVTGAAQYYLYVADNLTPLQPVISQSSVVGVTYAPLASQALTPGHSYTWYIGAESTNGNAIAWSGPQGFTLAPLAQPTQKGPSGTISPSAMTTFSWNAVGGAITITCTCSTPHRTMPSTIPPSAALRGPRR